jgi:hypothetical protein
MNDRRQLDQRLHRAHEAIVRHHEATVRIRRRFGLREPEPLERTVRSGEDRLTPVGYRWVA